MEHKFTLPNGLKCKITYKRGDTDTLVKISTESGNRIPKEVYSKYSLIISEQLFLSMPLPEPKEQ